MNYQEKIEKAKNELEKTKDKTIKMTFTVRTVKDERVCDDCAKHEDYSNDVYEGEVGVNHPPFHEGCRCFATYSMEGVRK